MDHIDQLFVLSHLLYVCLGLFDESFLYISIQFWLSVKILTILFCGTVNSTVAIAAASGLLADGQSSISVMKELLGYGLAVWTHSAPILVSCVPLLLREPSV